MSRYIYKRLLLMIPVVIMVAVLIFTIMYFTPGDPAIIILGPNASLEQLAAKRAELGIDQPYLVQLWNYLKNVFIRFDFGNSFINGRSVSSQIMERFPRTLMIAALSVLLSIVAGVPLGIVASVHQYTWKDNASMFAALIAASMPGFWIAAGVTSVHKNKDLLVGQPGKVFFYALREPDFRRSDVIIPHHGANKAP